MSIINLEQFEELTEAYPELAMCYDPTFITGKSAVLDMEELIADTSPN